VKYGGGIGGGNGGWWAGSEATTPSEIRKIRNVSSHIKSRKTSVEIQREIKAKSSSKSGEIPNCDTSYC